MQKRGDCWRDFWEFHLDYALETNEREAQPDPVGCPGGVAKHVRRVKPHDGHDTCARVTRLSTFVERLPGIRLHRDSVNLAIRAIG
jgi:hypothetical protein